MTSKIVFEWTHSNFLSVYTETPSQLFEKSFDRTLVGKVYEDRRFLTFWKNGKMKSRRIRKNQAIIDVVLIHIPEVRTMARKGVLGDIVAVDAKTVVIEVERRVSKLEQMFNEAGENNL